VGDWNPAKAISKTHNVVRGDHDDGTDSTELTMKAQCPPIGNPTQNESLGNSSVVSG
jgi:hypothetical protein